MAWTSYLPDSPDHLSKIEGWLALAVLVFGVLATVSGYVAVKVRGYRATLENKAVEIELSNARTQLSDAKTELGEARKNSEAARKETQQVRERLTPRDIPSEKRSGI